MSFAPHEQTYVLLIYY